MSALSPGPVVLAARGLCAGHGGQAVVSELDLTVHAGEVVALVGPHGAGKSTALLTLAGALPALGGTVEWRGLTTRGRLASRARDGLALLTPAGPVLPGRSVRANLRLGRCDPAAATAVFGELVPLLGRRAGSLTTDEHRLVAAARLLARNPAALLVDEVSAGVRPETADRVLLAVRRVADAGAAVVLAEQHVRKALAVADRVLLLRRGRIEFAGTAAEARDRVAAIEAEYLTVA